MTREDIELMLDKMNKVEDSITKAIKHVTGTEPIKWPDKIDMCYKEQSIYDYMKLRPSPDGIFIKDLSKMATII
jgi:hypothetical protein